jgi:hypothetical protein
VSYVIGQLSGILIAIIMLRTRSFGRLVPYTLIIGNVVGFGYYLPKAGLAVSAFSGVVLWVWYIAITRSFSNLGRSKDATTDRGAEGAASRTAPAAQGDRPGSGTSPWRAQDGCSRMRVDRGRAGHYWSCRRRYRMSRIPDFPCRGEAVCTLSTDLGKP